jgi:crotonobetainyl-CoA:carnitine CoA-transferase CaiB-like acyl-CoA transferase
MKPSKIDATNHTGDGPGLLAGVRVIDLTRILAGPYCTMMLADLGADTIKIEMPGRGDDTRYWGPPFAEGGESAYFLSTNRNKRSLTLNLKAERGLEILRTLIAQGDVLVENFRTGTLERWGLSYEELQRVRPGLIYCTITGYGYTGPYRDRPGYDFIVQALGGFMSVTGRSRANPHAPASPSPILPAASMPPTPSWRRCLLVSERVPGSGSMSRCWIAKSP